MARNGRTKVIYKGTFVSIQTLLGLIATAMYIATRRARLEAREAGFLVNLYNRACVINFDL